MQTPLNPTWNLNVLFDGGSQSQSFTTYLQSLETDIRELFTSLSYLQNHSQNRETIGELASTVLLQIQDVLKRIREAESFTGCLTAENQADKKAVMLSGQVRSLGADLQSVLTRFDEWLSLLPEDLFEELLQMDVWNQVVFSLKERRELVKEKLPANEETLVNELAVDGYHGWSELYDTTVSRIRIPFEDNGETRLISAGQFANKLDSPDPIQRERYFKQWEETWAEQADFCADALNHLAGFRSRLYKRRGWLSIHKDPLAINRMSEQTLQVMWDVIERNKSVFVSYLERKAKLLGMEALAWWDVEAPLGAAGKSFTYDEGARMIVEQFSHFSPKMAAFAIQAFEENWIEAEDRSGKRPGGFCTSFPVSGQTRIFMTYAGSASNVSTLAHELGHAYHQHVMNDLPAFAQEYAMNVAETASTFAELIVSHAAVQQATDRDEKIFLLEDKIQRAVAFFMNIHARFIFETQFYAEREKGLVGIDQLNAMMVEAQKTAFHNALREYHPHFWAAKGHFYFTDVPFYNFPYTFGFLFSAGLYAEALRQGASFEEKYIALLRDTASMTVEDLAMKHLGVDLSKPDFWQKAVEVSIADVEQFLELTETM